MLFHIASYLFNLGLPLFGLDNLCFLVLCDLDVRFGLTLVLASEERADEGGKCPHQRKDSVTHGAASAVR